MKKEPIHIKFQNQQNSNAQFDIFRLEDLLQRTDLNHSIFINHNVEFYILLFFEDGEGKHSIDFIDYQCTKGTLIAIRKNQIQKFFKKHTLRGRLLLFTDDFLVSYFEEMEAHKTILLFNDFLGSPKLQLPEFDFLSISQIIDRIEDEYFKVNDKHSLSIIRSELHILITKLFRTKAISEKINYERKYLQEFILFQQLIESNVEKTTRVRDFAQMMGLSTKTLNTITKSIVHKTAKELIDEICIKKIKRLLINTELSVKEIAYRSGFPETTNFYKYFKRNTQNTPEKFRTTN